MKSLRVALARANSLRLLVLGMSAVSMISLASASPFRLAIVRGASMTPTLKPGTVILYDTSFYTRNSVRSGDIVILRIGQEIWVKRIFAVADSSFWALNERLDGRKTTSPLNGEEVARLSRVARYLRRKHQDVTVGLERVQAGHVFVLGDSMTGTDSRLVGQIPISRIVGRVLEFPGQEG